MKYLHSITRSCPCCGTKSVLKLSDAEWTNFNAYSEGYGTIQSMFSTLTPAEREFLKTGYCPFCQKLIFGQADTNRIHPYSEDSIQ